MILTMKKLPFLFCALLAMAGAARADEQLRQVQQSLKDGGFYYGVVDGEEGSETNAAVRRYQIRNGLEVTGKLNAQTLGALHVAGAAGAAGAAGPAPEPREEEAPSPPPPVSPRPNVVESDKTFLRKSVPPPAAAPVEQDEPEAVPPPSPGPSLAMIFQRTPYENAPLVVQRDTLKRAQARMGRDGFYRGPIDGDPGFDTTRALRNYQRDADLPATGRLDLATLSDMNLLPGRRTYVPAPRFEEEPPVRRVYRGIWVH